MIKVIRQGVYYMEDRPIKESQAFMTSDKKAKAVKNTLTYRILSAHQKGAGKALRPDALLLFDPTDLLRTLDFVGLTSFPVPAYLFDLGFTGTFTRSAAKKWGGAYIPDGVASPAAYAAECIAKSGEVLLSTDRTPCGALGALSVWTNEGTALRILTGEGEECCRETVAVYLRGKPKKGVGPTDVALAVEKAVQKAGNFTKGKILEVFGAGLGSLSMDFRLALDGAFAATDCYATVWATDETAKEYFGALGRAGDFVSETPTQPAYYDGGVIVDLSSVEPMIGTDSGIGTVAEFLECAPDEYRREGEVVLGGANIRETAVTFETMAEVSEILKEKTVPNSANFGWWETHSGATLLALTESGYLARLLREGITFGYSVPEGGLEANDGDSFPHGIRLDARTIAASFANGGILTPATSVEYTKRFKKYEFDAALYAGRVRNFVGAADGSAPIDYSGVDPLPAFPPLPETVEAVIDGEEGAVAIVLDGSDDSYPWARTVMERERGVVAVLSKEFTPAFRTHLIDWGILPLTYTKFAFREGDVLRIEKAAELVRSGEEKVIAEIAGKRSKRSVTLSLGALTRKEREILLAGGKNNLVRGSK